MYLTIRNNEIVIENPKGTITSIKGQNVVSYDLQNDRTGFSFRQNNGVISTIVYANIEKYNGSLVIPSIDTILADILLNTGFNAIASGSPSICPDFYSSVALEASGVAKASAGVFYALHGHSTVDQFVQLHDAASLPADPAIPKISFAVAANENFYFEPDEPIYFSAGIVVSNSSTLATKTIGGSTCWFNLQYK